LASEKRQAVLHLFAIIVRRRFLDLGPTLAAAAFDARLVAGTADDCGVLLGNSHQIWVLAFAGMAPIQSPKRFFSSLLGDIQAYF